MKILVIALVDLKVISNQVLRERITGCPKKWPARLPAWQALRFSSPSASLRIFSLPA